MSYHGLLSVLINSFLSSATSSLSTSVFIALWRFSIELFVGIAIIHYSKFSRFLNLHFSLDFTVTFPMIYNYERRILHFGELVSGSKDKCKYRRVHRVLLNTAETN
jgi:hypothetical protein